jgi:membrane-bound serine protease (ClpP class)
MDLWVWSVLLLLLGLAIIAAEFFLPTSGLLGTVATLAIVGSLVCAFLSSRTVGVAMSVVVLVVVPLMFASAVHWWPHTPIGQLVLNTPPDNPDEVLPQTDPRYELRSMIGMAAIAKTKMLPSGVIELDGRSYDAVSDGQPVESGERVRIVGVDMNRLEVRPDPTIVAEVAPPAPSEDILKRPLDALGLESLDHTEPS